MRAAPAGAGGSRPDPELPAAVTHPLAFPRALRLRAPRDFEACRSPTFRASARCLSLAARVMDDKGEAAPARVRIGLTVGKRMARKSVQRSAVKRVLREAARHALPRLARAAGMRRVDVVLRLRAEFPAAADMPLAVFRRGLRAEADTLLSRLIEHLAAPAAIRP